MSIVYPTIDGWVGYGEGAEMLLRTNTPLDSRHPLVKERPDLFTASPLPSVADAAAQTARIRELEAQVADLTAKSRPAAKKAAGG